MSRQLRWPVLLTGSFVLVALVLALAIFSIHTRAQGQRLPDGTFLSLEAVTYGQQHQIVRGTWWQKLLNPLLSGEARNRLGIMFPSHRSANPDTLVFWTLREPPPHSTARVMRPWEARAVVFDEAGHESETAVRVQGAGANYLPPVVETWEVGAFPRRGRRVGLRLYTRLPDGEWRPAAQFLAGNPSSGPYPVWRPRSLPDSMRQGGLAFTLTRFRTGVDLAGGPHPPSPVEAWTEATFQVTENGKPTTAWEPADVTLSDATGNVWKPAVCMHDRKDGAARLFFRGALWPGEPAWKLHVEFVPGMPKDPRSVWALRGASMPRPGLYARSDARLVRGGVTFRLMGISGEGGRPNAPVGMVTNPEIPAAYVRLSPPPQHLRLRLASATDERGRPCALSRPQGGFVGQYSFRFLAPPGAKRLDLSFAPQGPTRVVEFLAAPAFADQGASAPLRGSAEVPR